RTLSLHDALPICCTPPAARCRSARRTRRCRRSALRRRASRIRCRGSRAAVERGDRVGLSLLASSGMPLIRPPGTFSRREKDLDQAATDAEIPVPLGEGGPFGSAHGFLPPPPPPPPPPPAGGRAVPP